MEDPGLLSAFVDNLVSRLFSLAEEKYKLYKGFESDLAFLMRELPMITSAIDGQLLGQEDHVLHLSVEELREVAHQMEDCIDHIMYDASWEQQQPWYCKMLSPGKKRKSRSQLGKEMQQLRCRLEEALHRQQRYTLSRPSTSQQAESSLYQHILRDDLVGIDAQLNDLIEQLAEMEGQPKQLKVISIVGFCGLGKTVLARELYNSDVGKQFEERAWVCGAHGDPGKLLSEVLCQLHKTADLVTSNVDQLSTDLYNYLNNKRYLIIIDGMGTDQWSIIKSAFPRNQDVSSRIVVTTKIQSVANTCSSTNGYMHKMRRLDEKHSKQLFLKNACPGDYLDYFQPDSAEILKKCDGQPLALTTVGHFMRKKSWPTGHYCEDVCNQVRFYDLQSGDDTLDRMHQVLIHDYASLPSHALKACFLYFAMFPSDQPVRAKKLKRQWLAEGFLRPTKFCSDPAAKNFEKLMDHNIIQPVNVSNNTKVKTCKTYGMMHEFITLKSLCENFITLFDGRELQPKHVRRISLHHKSITDETSLKNDLSLVRSLIVFGQAGKNMLNFNKYHLLRVLDLEECTDLQNDHLSEVCNLLLLRYLSLGGNVTSLPKEIKQLKLLETLDLRRTNIKILPIEVIQLPHLIHLFGKFKLPEKAMQDELLQKFMASGKCSLQTVGGFFVDESEGFVEIMGYMKKLRKVKIWCESCATTAKLTTLQKAIQEFIHDEKDASNDPRSLSLHFDRCSEDFLNDLKAPCYLRSLKLQGRLLELPGFVTALRHLRELCLQSTKMTAVLLTALTNLKHLQYLKLIADELEEINIKDKALPRLLCLCFVLQSPTFPKVEDGALPFLKSLQLICKDMNGLSGIHIKGFTRLSEVMLDCRVTDSTKANWVRAAKEHPNRPIVLLRRTIAPKLDHGGDATAAGETENEILDCSVLPEEQVQETHSQMPHDEPDSTFNNMGHPAVCAALTGSSIANNSRVAS
ncbi:hypothetical protein HU200_016555 [Digitaria exilis]|uniref:Uncharacterized protein n=1 Tax=Digitaria exilis TaxID=1010633 RepID=A0A835F828_9POAL|nr:hypothetical protein HU200_016555 [Digitaria exilis]